MSIQFHVLQNANEPHDESPVLAHFTNDFSLFVLLPLPQLFFPVSERIRSPFHSHVSQTRHCHMYQNNRISIRSPVDCINREPSGAAISIPLCSPFSCSKGIGYDSFRWPHPLGTLVVYLGSFAWTFLTPKNKRVTQSAMIPAIKKRRT